MPQGWSPLDGSPRGSAARRGRAKTLRVDQCVGKPFRQTHMLRNACQPAQAFGPQRGRRPLTPCGWALGGTTLPQSRLPTSRLLMDLGRDVRRSCSPDAASGERRAEFGPAPPRCQRPSFRNAARHGSVAPGGLEMRSRGIATPRASPNIAGANGVSPWPRTPRPPAVGFTNWSRQLVIRLCENRQGPRRQFRGDRQCRASSRRVRSRATISSKNSCGRRCAPGSGCRAPPFPRSASFASSTGSAA